MLETFKGIAHSLVRNPEELSSAAPLLVVLGILFLLFGGMIFVIVRTLRAPKWEPEATDKKSADEEKGLVFLNTEGKWRRFFKRYFLSGFDDSAYQAALAELAHLRFLLEKMEKDNAQLRDQLAKALHRNDELSYEFKGFDQKISSSQQELKTAHEQRQRATERVAELEAQLRESVTELDKIYEQNAKALEEANSRRAKAQKRSEELETQMADFLKTLEHVYKSGNLGKLLTIAPSLKGITTEIQSRDGADPAELKKYQSLAEDQDKELAKMRHVLKIAKEQIVVLTKKQASR